MADRTRVGAVAEFEDGAIFDFDIGGEAVAVVQVRGRFYAFANRCTHWGVALTEGYVSGGQVVCPYHESAFDLRTGAAIGGPAPEDLRIYRVDVEGEDVFVHDGD